MTLIETMRKDLISFHGSLQRKPSLHDKVHFQQKISLHGKRLQKCLKPNMKYIRMDIRTAYQYWLSAGIDECHEGLSKDGTRYADRL